MHTYRLSRNVERSIIDFLTEELDKDGWTNIYIEKSFSQIYKGKFPAILVNVVSRPDARLEIGTNSLIKFINVEIRLFCTDDGMRLDLSDWVLEKIIQGIPYYEFTISDGQISEKTQKGRIVILEVTQNRKELVNLEGLAKEDKFRHLLAFSTRVSING